jgi:photosynthetic reaction center H subunit
MVERRNESGERRQNDRHLFKLTELDDYNVASGDPDVRGWSILDRDRNEFGRIDELIVDPDRKKVRYLDVVPNTQSSVDEGDLHMLIPVGAARIADDGNKVIVDEIDQEHLRSYPMHRGDYISRDIENQVVEKFNRPGGANRNRTDAADFYEDELYDENRFYSGRNQNRKL